MRKLFVALSVALVLSTIPEIPTADAGRFGFGRILRVPRIIPRVIVGGVIARHVWRHSFAVLPLVVIGVPVYMVLREHERVHVARFSEDVINRDPDQQVTDTWQSDDQQRAVTIKVSAQRPVEEYLTDPTIKAAAERDRDNKAKGMLVLAKDEDYSGGKGGGDGGMMPGAKGSNSASSSGGLGQSLGAPSGKSTMTADNSEKKTSADGNPFDAKSEKVTGGGAWTPAKDDGPDPDRITPADKGGDAAKTETADKSGSDKTETADKSADKTAADKSDDKADDKAAADKSGDDKTKTADASDAKGKPEETDLKILLAEVPAGTPCRKVDTELTVKAKKKSSEPPQPTLNTSVVCRSGDGKWQPALQIAGNG